MQDNNLYTTQEHFLVVLDSLNADTKNNGSWNSSVTFNFEQPIRMKTSTLSLTCSVLTFTTPNSLNNINEINNIFSLTEVFSGTGHIYTLVIPYGQYNVNTFITQFTLSLSTYSSNFILSFNNVTNKFTLTNSVNNFYIGKATTLSSIMGLTKGVTTSLCIVPYIFPYVVNFNGLQSFNISFANLNTSNINSFTKSSSSIIQSILINPILPVIEYKGSMNCDFRIQQNIIDTISIDIQDNQDNFINFNNQSWNLTLCFTETRDMDRFSYQKSFQNIINYG